MEKRSKKKALLIASVAGLMALSGVVAGSQPAFAEDVSCSGVNKCKGVGECGGANHSCAGKNECKGQGWIKIPAEICDKVGGTVVPAAH